MKRSLCAVGAALLVAACRAAVPETAAVPGAAAVQAAPSEVELAGGVFRRAGWAWLSASPGAVLREAPDGGYCGSGARAGIATSGATACFYDDTLSDGFDRAVLFSESRDLHTFVLRIPVPYRTVRPAGWSG